MLHPDQQNSDCGVQENVKNKQGSNRGEHKILRQDLVISWFESSNIVEPVGEVEIIKQNLNHHAFDGQRNIPLHITQHRFMLFRIRVGQGEGF